MSAEVNCHECGAHLGRNSTVVFDGPHGGEGTASVQDSCNNGDVQLSDYVSRRTDGKRWAYHSLDFSDMQRYALNSMFSSNTVI